MTDRVNGGIQGGEFLTGKMDFFAMSTSLLMDQTNVHAPVQDLYQISAVVWTPVTVRDGHGVSQTYATKADYIAAWKKQQNLDKIINVFGLRANPVMISVSNGGDINIATEKTGLWYVDNGVGNYGNPATDTNYTGFKLEDELTAVSYWAAGDDVITGAPSDAMTFGMGGNTTVSRRVAL